MERLPITFAEHVSFPQIMTGSGDGSCALWDIQSEKLLKRFTGHKADVTSLDLSHSESGSILATAVSCNYLVFSTTSDVLFALFVLQSADKMVRIWDIRSGSCVQQFAGHESVVRSVRFYPSGDAVGTGSDDASVRRRHSVQLLHLRQSTVSCVLVSPLRLASRSRGLLL